jgi:transcriptional regulator with XRE-family HTH domain
MSWQYLSIYAITQRVSSVRRYEIWGEFLKAARKRKYRSAREFCARARLEISYPQYSRYESGEQLPGLGQAIRLFRHLEVPVLEGVLEWSRAQITDAAAQQAVEGHLGRLRSGVSANPAPEAAGASVASGPLPLDEMIVFNRAHLKLFSSDPFYRDIFTYLNSCAPRWVAASEVGQSLGLEAARAQEMLGLLRDLGVVVEEQGGYRAAKRIFYFPDDPDFFELRNLNLAHNTRAILGRLSHGDIARKRAYRGLITRELNSAQVAHVIARMDQLLSETLHLPESDSSDRIYSVCTLVGERFALPPLRLDPPQP